MPRPLIGDCSTPSFDGCLQVPRPLIGDCSTPSFDGCLQVPRPLIGDCSTPSFDGCLQVPRPLIGDCSTPSFDGCLQVPLTLMVPVLMATELDAGAKLQVCRPHTSLMVIDVSSVVRDLTTIHPGSNHHYLHIISYIWDLLDGAVDLVGARAIQRKWKERDVLTFVDSCNV